MSIEAVLSQVQDGRERVIAYASRTLNKTERNYCVTDRELLAVKQFVEHYRYYLLGREFTIRIDHQALKWLFTLRDPNCRIARWIEILSAYDFVIEYHIRKRHGNANGMSRCPDPRACKYLGTDNALQCGPCEKCMKRSVDMDSPIITAQDVDPVQRTGCPKQHGKCVSWFTRVFLVLITSLTWWRQLVPTKSKTDVSCGDQSQGNPTARPTSPHCGDTNPTDGRTRPKQAERTCNLRWPTLDGKTLAGFFRKVQTRSSAKTGTPLLAPPVNPVPNKVKPIKGLPGPVRF